MTKEPRIDNEERVISSENGVGKPGQPHGKHETSSLIYTIHKN